MEIVNTYVICFIFLSISIGTLAGIYTGMAFAEKLSSPKKKRIWGKKQLLKKNQLQNPKQVEASKKEKIRRNDIKKEEISEIKNGNEDPSSYGTKETGISSSIEETNEGQKDGMDDTNQSYLEFICESVGQDAVSKMRAARKTQDNKYMNRIKKKKS